VFTRAASGDWVQQGGKLVGTGGGQNDADDQEVTQSSVALSADGSVLAVGGHYDKPSGAVWLFKRSSAGEWAQQGNKLTESDSTDADSDVKSAELFGRSVSLSGDGLLLAVGA
jgi:hypothetical protein